jgi:hypothetical protein
MGEGVSVQNSKLNLVDLNTPDACGSPLRPVRIDDTVGAVIKLMPAIADLSR